jgi:glycosyltransferase 2 family protein
VPLKIAAAKSSSFSSTKKIVRMILIVIIIGLLANIFISFLVGFNTLGRELSRLRWEHVVVPFAIFIAIYFIDSLRLKMVLRQFNYRIGIGAAFVNSLMGYFFSNLTPMATGGQPFQIYHLKKCGIDAKTSTNIIMTRFIEYMGSAIILVLLFIPLLLPLLNRMNAQTTFLIIGFSVSLAASVIIAFLFIRPDWVGAFLVRIEHSFLGRFISRVSKKKDWAKTAHAWSHDLKRNIAFLWKEKFHIILVDVILCVIILGLQMFSLAWVLVTFVGVQLDFLKVFATLLLLNLVVYYIPTPGASGGIEGAYTAAFALFFDWPSQPVFVAVAVWRIATYYLHIFFGMGVFMVMRKQGLFANNELAQKKEPGESAAD